MVVSFCDASVVGSIGACVFLRKPGSGATTSGEATYCVLPYIRLSGLTVKLMNAGDELDESEIQLSVNAL
jgi:hypothetical protein